MAAFASELTNQLGDLFHDAVIASYLPVSKVG